MFRWPTKTLLSRCVKSIESIVVSEYLASARKKAIRYWRGKRACWEGVYVW